MNKFFKIFTVSLILFSFTINAQDKGIIFTTNKWDEVIKQAKKEKKIIFVDAYTTWCGPCKQMANTTFKDSIVGKLFNDNFISLQIDMEKEEGFAFGKKYPVTAYPTIFFIDKDGKVMKKAVGAIGSTQIITMAKLVIDPTSSETYKLKKKYDKGDKSYENMSAYLDAAMAESVDPDEIIVNKYLNETPKDSIFNEMPFTVFYLFIHRLDNEYSINFAKNYETATMIWGENASNKANELINEGVSEVLAGKEKRQYIYDFIKILKANNEEEYNDFKKLIDDFIDKNMEKQD